MTPITPPFSTSPLALTAQLSHPVQRRSEVLLQAQLVDNTGLQTHTHLYSARGRFGSLGCRKHDELLLQTRALSIQALAAPGASVNLEYKPAPAL
jgi:hypothetical protein